MSTRNAEISACPTPIPFDETERVLDELAALEAALMLEVARLKNARAPHLRRPGVLRYHGRDIWWWRVMLVAWAGSRRAAQSHPRDALAGLKLALKHWSDRELRAFLSRLPMSVHHLPPAA